MKLKLSISNTFASIQNRCALVPFITAGDPNLNVTKKALNILAEQGADIIELGFPYSDPLADGPTIQAASSRALQNHITVDQILKMVKELTQEISTPLVAFTYYNLVINKGISKFVIQIKSAGFKGLLVPDLPLEEIDILEKECRHNNIELILLISPNTSSKRIQKILKKAHGCVYLVSSTGVTGMGFKPKESLLSLIKYIKSTKKTSLVVGFGISTQEDIQLVQSWGVDGIVMGSAFVNKLFESSDDPELSSFKTYCAYIKGSFS
uniref:tryptophan synthase alpha subunit n=1 Tax=Goniotrichopsis reniformis TaxID=468933 RepID=UPI001FCD3C12|nr:tryptophan synthase alpha subunit [Goniotrichopsis reniformis]UNJ14812.1 tryptophan synthase alpha subunit [Goniotrichopsis reniformis]